MATYIKGLTDVVPEIKPFQPNLNLVQQALGTLQNRYDQGFASVKNVYNQILNAPISNYGNQEVRDGFLKEAEMKLKNLASVDLSMPENQAAAEQVFAPFWEDNLILKDQGLTKAYKSELATANMYKNSKDEKMRSQYSETAMRYLENGLKKLQTAGRDPESFSKVEKRHFVPFQDLQAYLDERATKQGLEIKWQQDEGPVMKTITGGKKTVPSFESFAYNVLGDQFTDQFNVMATVEKEERVRQLKMLDPTLTDEQAVRELSRGMLKDQREVLTYRQSQVNSELERVRKELRPYETMTDFDDKQEATYKRLRAEEKELGEISTAAGKKVTSFDEQIKKDPDSFVVGLDGYYAGIIKDRAVRRWAAARAEKQDVKEERSVAWEAQRVVDKEKRDYDLNERRTIVAEQNLLFQKYKWDHPQKTTKSKKSGSGGSGDSDDEEEVDITDPRQVGRVDAIDAGHATKRGEDDVEIFEKEQGEKWNAAHQLLLSNDVGGRLLDKKGVPRADAVQYLGAMKRLISNSKGDLSEKDKGLLFNFSQVLQGKNKPEDLVGIDLEGGKITKTVADFTKANKDFYGVRKDLLASLGAELGEIYREDGPELNPKDFRMMIAYMTATQKLDQYNSLEAGKSKSVEDFFIKHENDKAYKNFVTVKNGKKQVVGVDDLVPYFQTTVFEALDAPPDEDGNPKKITLTPQELAKAYMKGEFKESGQYGLHAVRINGAEYKMVQYGPVTVEEQLEQVKEGKLKDYDVQYPAGQFNYAMLQLNKLYESSEGFKGKMDNVKKAIVKDLPQIKERRGVQGYVVSYEFHRAKNPDNDVASQLVKDAHNPSNFEGIYIGEDMLHKDDPQYEKVLKAMRQGELDLEKTFSIVRVNMRGINGRPSLELQFKQATKKTPEGEEDNTDYVGDMAGKTVEIDLNPNPTGEMLQQIRNNPDNYVYGGLMEGKVFKSDAILNNTHISFEIVPNDPDHPTGATLLMHAKEWKNGTYEDVPWEPVDYEWSGITPDQLVNEAYAMVAKQHNKNLALRKLDKAQKVQAKVTKTKAEIDKELAGGG